MKLFALVVGIFLLVGCDFNLLSTENYTEVWLHTISEDDCKMIVLGDGVDTLRINHLWTLKESDPSRSSMNTSRLTVSAIGKYEYLTVVAIGNESFKSDIQIDNRTDIYVKLSLKGNPVEFPSDSLNFAEITRKH
jgi:hypothetical protein